MKEIKKKPHREFPGGPVRFCAFIMWRAQFSVPAQGTDIPQASQCRGRKFFLTETGKACDKNQQFS